MKSIFKKIAFVLALAMVVTMLPAKTAAAASHEPDMYKTLRLYLDSGNGEGSEAGEGNDITGNLKGERYASVWGWRENGYDKVMFESADTDIATVNSKGKVTAVKVGSTTVTATFTGEDVDTVVKECVVTVKRNAAKVGLSADSAKKVEAGFTVGDKLQLTAVRKDAEGNTEWNRTQKNYTTDSVRFKSSDENVFKVTKTTGMLTAVGTGEATLTIWTVQSEGKDAVTGEYPMGVSKEYTVVVKQGMIAQQSAHNAFEVTFDTEATAKAAVDETSKYFTSASADVTEKEDIVKVYRVLKNASNEKIGETAVIIGKLSQRGDVKNVVDVTMFDELDQQTDYIIRYKDKEVTVTTTKNVAAKLKVSAGSSETLGEDTSKTNVSLRIYAAGANGQDVDITDCRDYLGWRASVTLEEISNTQYHVEYNFVTDPLNPVIYFYTKDSNIAVNVKATFKDYFNEEKKGNELTDTTTIRPGNHSLVRGQIMAWGVADDGKIHWDWDAFNSKEFAADDLGKKLIIDADVYYGNEKVDVTSCCDSKFTFKTENEDKLIVDEEHGNLFPPKEPKDGIVNIYVYYDEMYIGVCPVKVWAKREFTGFSASVDSQKLSYNPGGDVDDVIVLTMNPVDQLGAAFTRDMTLSFEVYGNSTVKDYVEFYGKYCDEGSNAGKWWTVTSPDQIWDGSYQVKIKAKNLPANQLSSIRVLCTATYNDGITKKTLTAAVAFSAKNTAGAAVKNYQLVAKNDIDMKLTGNDWESGRIQDKTVTIKAYSLDRDGFKIEHLALTAKSSAIANTDINQNTVIINQLNDYVGSPDLVANANGKDLDFVPVRVVNDVKVVSGSAIDSLSSATRTAAVAAADIEGRQLIQKIKTGSYQVSLFISENSAKPSYKAGTVIKVNDTQPAVAWNWDHRSVSEPAATVSGVVDAVREAFTFKKLNDDNTDAYISGNIYVGYVKKNRDGSYPTDNAGNYTVVLSDDFVVQGDYVSVKQVRCIVTYKETIDGVTSTYYYEMIIPIDKSIKVGVTQ